MTRTSGGRLAAAIVLALAALPLSGCLYAQIPEHPTIIDDPISTDEPIEDPTDGPSTGLPATMSFTDGASLPATAYIQWGDGLFADDGWQLSSPDDGNGNWAYTSTDGLCTAAFWQGRLEGLETVTDDDRTTTEDVLEYFLGTGLQFQTASLSYQTGGTRVLDALIASWTESGHERAVISRGFGVPGVGIYLSLDCTGGDIIMVMSELIDANSVIITG